MKNNFSIFSKLIEEYSYVLLLLLFYIFKLFILTYKISKIITPVCQFILKTVKDIQGFDNVEYLDRIILYCWIFDMEGFSDELKRFTGEQEVLGDEGKVAAEWERRSLTDALKKMLMCQFDVT